MSIKVSYRRNKKKIFIIFEDSLTTGKTEFRLKNALICEPTNAAIRAVEYGYCLLGYQESFEGFSDKFFENLVSTTEQVLTDIDAFSFETIRNAETTRHLYLNPWDEKLLESADVLQSEVDDLGLDSYLGKVIDVRITLKKTNSNALNFI